MERAAHRNGTEHLEIPRAPPRRLVEQREVSGRDRARVVDEDVELADRVREALDRLRRREVRCDGAHGDGRPIPNVAGDNIEIARGAGDEHHVAAFVRERHRARATDALRCTRDEGGLAGELEIHGPSSARSQRSVARRSASYSTGASVIRR